MDSEGLRKFFKAGSWRGRSKARVSGQGQRPQLKAAAGGLERSKVGGERVENAGAQREKVELALAANLDEACGFKLFDVVRERGGGDRQRGAGLRAAQRAIGLGDLFKQLEAARIGERFQDGGAFGAGQACGFRRCSGRGWFGGLCDRVHARLTDIGCNGIAAGTSVPLGSEGKLRGSERCMRGVIQVTPLSATKVRFNPRGKVNSNDIYRPRSGDFSRLYAACGR